MVVGDDDDDHDDDDDDEDENDDTQQYCAKPGCFNYPPKVAFCFFPPNGRDGKQTVSAMYSHQIGIEDKVTRQNQDAKIHISMFNFSDVSAPGHVSFELVYISFLLDFFWGILKSSFFRRCGSNTWTLNAGSQ